MPGPRRASRSLVPPRRASRPADTRTGHTRMSGRACGRSAIPWGALSRTNIAGNEHGGDRTFTTGATTTRWPTKAEVASAATMFYGRTGSNEAGVLCSCGYDRRWVKNSISGPAGPISLSCEIDSCAQTELDGFRPVRQLLFERNNNRVAGDIIRSACGMAPRGERPPRAAGEGGRGRGGRGGRGARGARGARGGRRRYARRPVAVGRGRCRLDGAEACACACACACGEAEEAFEGVGCATRGRRGARASRRGRRRGGGAGGGRATRRRGGGDPRARTARGGEDGRRRRGRGGARFARRTRTRRVASLPTT